MAKNQKDSQGRTLQDGEGQLKDGRYVYTNRDNLNKQKKAYSWTLLPSDRIPKGKKKDKCLRDKEKQIQADLAAGLSVSELQRKRTMELYLTLPKTDSGARKVPLTPDVEECLHHIIKCRKTPLNELEVRSDDDTMKASEFLFFDKDGKPMVAQTVENHYRWASKVFKRDVEGATDKMISSHVARHTYCSLRVKEGMQPVTFQKIMCHSSIRTTLGWYTHIEEGDIITEELTLMSKDGSVMEYDEKCNTDKYIYH